MHRSNNAVIMQTEQLGRIETSCGGLGFQIIIDKCVKTLLPGH